MRAIAKIHREKWKCDALGVNKIVGAVRPQKSAITAYWSPCVVAQRCGFINVTDLKKLGMVCVEINKVLGEIGKTMLRNASERRMSTRLENVT